MGKRTRSLTRPKGYGIRARLPEVDGRFLCDHVRSTGIPKKRGGFMKRCPIRAIVIICVVVMGMSIVAEGKRRRSAPPPITIIDVRTDPDPFPVGNGMLTFTVMVKLPSSVEEDHVLEVSSLVTSPSKRSMRFLFERMPVHAVSADGGQRIVRVVLSWDGKDQTQQYVTPGTYHYDIRAKLMEDRGYGYQMVLISRHARGTLEVVNAPDRDGLPRQGFEPFDAEDEPPLENLTEEEALEEDQADRSDRDTSLPLLLHSESTERSGAAPTLVEPRPASPIPSSSGESLGFSEQVDPVREAAGSESIVDIDDPDAARTGVEHSEQGR